MKKKTVIIFNGPPNSGKDVCTAYVVNRLKASGIHATTMENKFQLRKIALVITGVSEEEWDSRYSDRELKDTPWDKCGGISQRDLYIKISEDWCKPHFGKSYFGDVSANRIINTDFEYYVFSDGGFIEEVDPIYDIVDRIIVIRLDRPGTSYKVDSRKYLYLDHPKVSSSDIENHGTLKQLFNYVDEVLSSFDIIYE